MMAAKKPNILILWGDDIGWWNISFNSRGQMGYRTPNIDRVANEGVAFTDYYAQQSCTAGRAAFITGQNPIRTGLTKVGAPGADVGLHAEDPTIAELLKPLVTPPASSARTIWGTRTSSCRPCMVSTNSSATFTTLTPRKSRRLPDYPKNPEFKKQFRPPGRAPLLGGRQGRTDHRRHRRADQEAHGNHR